MKCDEEKPFCLQCSTTGRKCDVYTHDSSRACQIPLPIPESIGSHTIIFDIQGDGQERRSFSFPRFKTALEIAGFIPKTLGIEVMREAMARVLQGGVWTPPDVDLARGADAETAAMIARLSTLTPQQVRVLMMLSGGLLNKQIAHELGVSEATVKAHVSAILQKLGVESRTQAVIAAGKIEAGQWPQLPAPRS